MCDIITRQHANRNLAEYCIRGSRFLCAAQEKCPNIWGDLGARSTRICDLHTSFCRYCARTFCPECIAAHEETCSMRPSEQPVTLYERVRKALTEAGMT